MASSFGESDKNAGSDPAKQFFGGNGHYGDISPDATEEGGRQAAPRKMSRIDQPRTKSISQSVGGRALEDSDSDVVDSVAKQMALEAGNEIQYRTCSWQKV